MISVYLLPGIVNQPPSVFFLTKSSFPLHPALQLPHSLAPELYSSGRPVLRNITLVSRLFFHFVADVFYSVAFTMDPTVELCFLSQFSYQKCQSESIFISWVARGCQRVNGSVKRVGRLAATLLFSPLPFGLVLLQHTFSSILLLSPQQTWCCVLAPVSQHETERASRWFQMLCPVKSHMGVGACG